MNESIVGQWEITRSLYIHWPFCPYKCHFCPFVAIASHDHYMDQYNAILVKEIKEFARSLNQKLHLDTIFLGGGTPSTWPGPPLLDTFDTLRDEFVIHEQTEINIEVNPGTADKEKLMLWKSIGINRLSIGVQSLKDSVLNALNRKQSKEDVFTILDEASTLFDNISIDLILGLPGVTCDDWQKLLHAVIQWPIKHISIYFLTIHENTPLYFKVKKNEVHLDPDETIVKLYHWSIAFLEQAGFLQYEISNFSKKGYECHHNRIYWERKPYKGFGIGAWSFDGKTRFQNTKNLMLYLQNLAHNKNITEFAEVLTEKQIYLERIMLGLRKTEGILLNELTQNLTTSECKNIQDALEIFESNNFIYRKNNRIGLTPSGLAIHNYIAARLSVD